MGSSPRPHVLVASSDSLPRTVAVRTDKRGEFWLCRVVEERGPELLVEWYDSPRRHQYVLTSRRDLIPLPSVIDQSVPLQQLPHSGFAVTAAQAADLAALATQAYNSTTGPSCFCPLLQRPSSPHPALTITLYCQP